MRRVKKAILFVIHAQVQSIARNDAARRLNVGPQGKIEGDPSLPNEKAMTNELVVRDFSLVVRSSAAIGKDVVGVGMRKNMGAIRKRVMRLRILDVMRDRWMREQQMSEKEMVLGSLRHAGILRERDGGKEIVFMASLKKTVAHAG
jgi:hypothetical protein